VNHPRSQGERHVTLQDWEQGWVRWSRILEKERRAREAEVTVIFFFIPFFFFRFLLVDSLAWVDHPRKSTL